VWAWASDTRMSSAASAGLWSGSSSPLKLSISYGSSPDSVRMLWITQVPQQSPTCFANLCQRVPAKQNCPSSAQMLVPLQCGVLIAPDSNVDELRTLQGHLVNHALQRDTMWTVSMGSLVNLYMTRCLENMQHQVHIPLSPRIYSSSAKYFAFFIHTSDCLKTVTSTTEARPSKLILIQNPMVITNCLNHNSSLDKHPVDQQNVKWIHYCIEFFSTIVCPPIVVWLLPQPYQTPIYISYATRNPQPAIWSLRTAFLSVLAMTNVHADITKGPTRHQWQ